MAPDAVDAGGGQHEVPASQYPEQETPTTGARRTDGNRRAFGRLPQAVRIDVLDVFAIVGIAIGSPEVCSEAVVAEACCSRQLHLGVDAAIEARA